MADLLRLLGPLTQDEVAERSTASDAGGWLEGLRAARRAVTVSYAGRTGGRPSRTSAGCATASGIAVPPGVPVSFTEPVADPLAELIGRYARTRGPFTTADAATRFGLGLRVTADVLGRLTARRKAGARRVLKRAS